MRIDVALTPALLSETERSVCIVVDVLRASTSCLAMFESGIQGIAVAGDPESARSLRNESMPDALLCGESGGVPPPGFDYGNSPVEFAGLSLTGRRAVLATSNGTRALHAVMGAPSVFVGCLRNRHAIARIALDEARTAAGVDGIQVVCAGNAFGASFSLDDTVTAGAIVHWLRQVQPDEGAYDELAVTDAASAAERLFEHYAADPIAAFREGTHGRALQALGFAADLEYCAALDRSACTPYLSIDKGGLLMLGARGPEA